MKKLLIYLRDYKKECVLSPLFKLLEASFELIVPLVMAELLIRVSHCRIARIFFIWVECWFYWH